MNRRRLFLSWTVLLSEIATILRAQELLAALVAGFTVKMSCPPLVNPTVRREGRYE
jgi:hypothetical protein